MQNIETAVRNFKTANAASVKVLATVQRITADEAKERLYRMGSRRLYAQRIARKYESAPLDRGGERR